MRSLLPAEMRSLWEPKLRLYFLASLLGTLGFGLSMVLMVVYLHDIRHLSIPFATGLLSINAIVLLLVSPLSGSLTDRFGPTAVFLVWTLVHAVALVSFAFADNVVWIVISSITMAASDGAMWGPGQTLLARLAGPERRQNAYGVNFMLVNVGVGVGGLVSAVVVNLHDPATFTALYLGTAVLTLAMAIPIWMLRSDGGAIEHEDPTAVGDRTGWHEVIRDRRLQRFMIAVLVLLTCGYGSLDAGFSLFVVNEVHLSLNVVGITLLCNTVAIVIGQLFVLRWLAGKSRSGALALVAIIWALAWAVVAVAPHVISAVALPLLCVAMVIFAAGETIWSPVGPALVNEIAPEHLRGRYNAAFGLTFGLSGVMGPLVAGALLGSSIAAAWPLVVGAGALVGCLLALSLRRHLTPVEDGRVTAVEGAA